MKLELIIFGIAGFLMYNTYHGNKYSKVLLSYKKYYQMIIIAIVAFSIYMLVRRDPMKSRQMLLYANNMVKYMPIDKSSMSIISPIFDPIPDDQNTLTKTVMCSAPQSTFLLWFWLSLSLLFFAATEQLIGSAHWQAPQFHFYNHYIFLPERIIFA